MKEKHILTLLDKYMFSTKNRDIMFPKNYDSAGRGHSNAGHSNAGHSNAGHSNAGHSNAGHSNAGHSNAGHSNAGHSNAKCEGNAQENNIIYPHQEDKLFWCFYIIMHGEDTYRYIDKNSFQVEKDIKITAIELMKKHAPQFKLHKLKYIDIENELLNEKCITISGLYALCLVNDISIIYLHNRTYYEINITNAKIDYIIEKRNTDSTHIHTKVSSDKINDIRNNYYRIENIKKPILSLSSYKIDQLKNICIKINIPVIDSVGKNKKKTELYENIVKYLS